MARMGKYVVTTIIASLLLSVVVVLGTVPWPWYAQLYVPINTVVATDYVSPSTNISASNTAIYQRHNPFKFSIFFRQPEKADIGRIVTVHAVKIYDNKAVYYNNDQLSLTYHFTGQQYQDKSENGVYHYTQNGGVSFSFLEEKMDTHFKDGQVLNFLLRYSVRNGGGHRYEKEVIFRHKAQTERGLWRYYGY